MKALIKRNNGVSLVELVVTLAILTVLSALILPSAQMTSKRLKEIELKRNLRIIRTALDDFKKTNDKATDEKKKIAVIMESGYPKSLNVLVEGHDFGGISNVKKKFLRKIPIDPFNPPKPGEEPKWGVRSYTDEPDSTNSNEEDVFDVYSLSEETAIDGTKYKDW